MSWKVRATILDAVVFGFLIMCAYFTFVAGGDKSFINLSLNAILSLASLAIGAVLSSIINKRTLTLGASVFAPSHLKPPAENWITTFWGMQLVLAFGLAFWTGLKVTEFSFYELLSEDGFGGAQRIFSSLTSPNFEILPRGVVSVIETIFIAFTATVLAIPVAFVLSFFCAKNIMGKSKVTFAIYSFLRICMNVTRSIEPLIWAIIFSVWVGIGPFAGMLALMLHSIASLSKQYSEIVESVNDGPIEGISATGARPLQVVWFAIVPQIVLPYVSFTIYRWDINVRMATIIGLVGGGGIGTMLIQYQGQALWNEVGTLILLIAIVVWLMDTASAYIREAIK